MKIVVIGQCSLHWGRMEFGNIGNYYIIEPLFRNLHGTFPEAKILTTMQMSDRFCKNEKITSVPLDTYYSWNSDYLKHAQKELKIAQHYLKFGKIETSTPFIDLVFDADLVINFSGDIWGKNADIIGPNRFLIGLIKDRVAQIFAKKTAMIAGSPGPFNNDETLDFAKLVYSKFDIVINREQLSSDLLKTLGFDVSSTHSLACPSFEFNSSSNITLEEIDSYKNFKEKSRTLVGFVLCGWNFERGPFDKKNRNMSEFEKFAQIIEYLVNQLNCNVCLLSHSNGFETPPKKFKPIHGRDFNILKQLDSLLQKRSNCSDYIILDKLLNPWETKKIISQFNFLVSGRVHASVAALSQNVPTVMIDYGDEFEAHKTKGFAQLVGVENFVCNPNDLKDIISKLTNCYNNLSEIKSYLNIQNPKIINQVKQHFSLLKGLI